MDTDTALYYKHASQDKVMSFMAALCLSAGKGHLADLCLIEMFTFVGAFDALGLKREFALA